MSASLLTVSYLGAGVLFILSLAGLANQETARRANVYGMIGMAIAVLATLFAADFGASGYAILGGTIVVGALIGAAVASRVAMTSMPELVAILHSFVGAAATLAGLSNHLQPLGVHVGVEAVIHDVEIFLGVFIGTITFTGSVIAFGKLRGSIRRTLMLPGRHLLNAALVLVCVVLGGLYLAADPATGLVYLLIMTAVSGVLGAHLVMAIGGADMPVVVSMLNSYSGWAAAALGFMLSNDLLIVTGALVGSSGAILSYVMCRAMNRSFLSVILGGFGQDAKGGGARAAAVEGEVKAIEIPDTVRLLEEAHEVVVVPGYGMAVSQAQHPLWEVARVLRERGKNVRFAIHPVAGRLPGHMNVLLAEANVPYDIVLEMDEINDDFLRTDLVLVIGANDIVNPAAQTDPDSPIAGMPVLEVWHAGTTIVMKRSMGTGYAGVDNPLFVDDNTRMLFGDARENVTRILAELKAAP